VKEERWPTHDDTRNNCGLDRTWRKKKEERAIASCLVGDILVALSAQDYGPNLTRGTFMLAQSLKALKVSASCHAALRAAVWAGTD